MKHRVVVTGMGTITCFGKGKETLFNHVIKGDVGVRHIDRFDTSNLKCKSGCYVPEDEYDKRLDTDRAHHLLFVAADEALKDADVLDSDKKNMGIFLGSIYGGMESWENVSDYIRHINKSCHIDSFNRYPLWALTENLSKEIGTLVAACSLSTACSSSDFALGLALNAIRDEEMDIALVGGVELLSRFIVSGFDSLNSLTLTACKPFDKNRDGLILGEGAGILIIEDYDHARKRNAHIYGEIAGFGSCYEAFDLARPEPTGKRRYTAATRALADADCLPDQISFVKAHGTGTPINDKIEILALKRIFKEKLPSIPITTYKSMIGHTCGACGAIEAIICFLCIQEGFIPPIANFKEAENESGLFFVKDYSRECKVKTILQMAAGFGGSNTSLIFREINHG